MSCSGLQTFTLHRQARGYPDFPQFQAPTGYAILRANARRQSAGELHHFLMEQRCLGSLSHAQTMEPRQGYEYAEITGSGDNETLDHLCGD